MKRDDSSLVGIITTARSMRSANSYEVTFHEVENSHIKDGWASDVVGQKLPVRMLVVDLHSAANQRRYLLGRSQCTEWVPGKGNYVAHVDPCIVHKG